MLQVVDPKDYPQIKRLADGLADQTMAQAVLDGTRPGIVVANDKEIPTAVFIAAPEGGFAWTYLAGCPDDPAFQRDLNRWLFDEKGLGRDVVFTFLVYSDASWVGSLEEVLAPRVAIPDRRLYYACTQTPKSWRGDVAAGYIIRPVDQELLDSDIEMPEKMTQWFDHNFGSHQAFLERGFGAVAMHSERIVGWCLADSIAASQSDIGPEVDEAHRQKGLAYGMTCLTLEQGFARGLERIGWHCHVINIQSVKTAEKAGFKFQYEYPAYAVHFDVEKHTELAQMIGDEIVGRRRTLH